MKGASENELILLNGMTAITFIIRSGLMCYFFWHKEFMKRNYVDNFQLFVTFFYYSALRADVDHHVNEINEKNRIIDELNKLKADADWSLGEHRQWLNDANNR